jgi:hypothetical protein
MKRKNSNTMSLYRKKIQNTWATVRTELRYSQGLTDNQLNSGLKYSRLYAL